MTDIGTQFFDWFTGQDDGSGQAAGAAIYQATTPFEQQISQYPDLVQAETTRENQAISDAATAALAPIAGFASNTVGWGIAVGVTVLAMLVFMERNHKRGYYR
jgi:hypothetical protein